MADRDIYWKAVVGSDARFDGVFVFGVKTTGVYCKPSCGSRLPKRENVDFYASTDEAERGGLRACKRCRPDAVGAADPIVESVLKACELIVQDESLTLDRLAGSFGVSASHFQRTFKDVIGVSPKKYADAIKMERFKNGLRDSGDVAGAMYEAGFGSSSRLYEKAADGLGMTPAAYKKGGSGMNITYAVTDCELGKMLVARTERGICSITFGDSRDELTAALRAEFGSAQISADDHGLRSAADAVIEYLAGKPVRSGLPLDLRATAFQLKVWEILRKIPYGETRTYTQIAEQLGDRKKVRAVARACASNNVAVIIPCHRVIASSGKLAGYRWGIERKRKLLEKEAAKDR